MKTSIDGMEIPFECPSCSKAFKKTIGWLNTHKTSVCTCGKTINIDDKSFTGVRKSMADLEKEVAKLNRELGKLF